MSEQADGHSAAPEAANTASGSLDSVFASMERAQSAPKPEAPKAADAASPEAERQDDLEAPDAPEDTAEPDDLDLIEDDLGDDDDEPEQPTETVHKVTIDGKEVEVPLAELIKGYSRQADYTRKAQALAKEREAIEVQAKELPAKIEAIEAKARQYDEFLRWSDSVIKAEDEKFANVDWARLQQEDWGEFQKMLAAERMHQINKQKIEAQAKQREAERQAYERDQLARQQQTLRKHFDEKYGWTDEGRRKTEIAEIEEAAKHYGLSDQELAALSEPKYWDILRDAAKRRAAVAKFSAKKGEGAPPQPINVDKVGKTRPAASTLRASDARAAISKARSTGSLNDVLAAMEKSGR